MPPTRLAYLFQRYFEKTATDAERMEFMSLLQDPAAESELKTLMDKAWEDFRKNDELPHFTPMQSRELLKGIFSSQEALGSLAVIRPPVRRMTWGWAVAASLLFLVLCGGAWWLSRPVTHPGFAQAAKPAKSLPEDVAPGGNKAMLILDDGSKIALDSTHEGAITRQGNMQVLKLSGGRLAYQPAGNQTSAASISYNMISTPRGGQYQVILPDGTKAWLNAASTLRFPTAFTGNDRAVELTGEGYFEVAKDKEHPFRVSVKPATGENRTETQIEVLGTSFNIMAYNEEGTINTSLLDGSVRVTGGARSVLLKPGEQAGYSRESGDLKTGTADMELAIAWKNGLFQFEGATIENVMHQVARWYNVEVVYKGKIPKHFSGLISRYATLSQVLKMLEMAGEAKFQLDGNTVSVIPV